MNLGVFFVGHSQINKAPKSLREWHEQPVNLLEQPSLEKVNVQILSPNHDRVFEKSKSEDNLSTLAEPSNIIFPQSSE